MINYLIPHAGILLGSENQAHAVSLMLSMVVALCTALLLDEAALVINNLANFGLEPPGASSS